MTPGDSPPPSCSKLSRQDVALILGSLQKISLGKASHDSWAAWWQLSVDNTEKESEQQVLWRRLDEGNQVYTENPTGESWNCAKQLQMLKKGGEKKNTLRRIPENVSYVVVLVSQRHHVLSTDCLWLIFYAAWQEGMWQVLSQSLQSGKTGLCSSLLAQETKKPIKTPSRVSSSGGGT